MWSRRWAIDMPEKQSVSERFIFGSSRHIPIDGKTKPGSIVVTGLCGLACIEIRNELQATRPLHSARHGIARKSRCVVVVATTSAHPIAWLIPHRRAMRVVTANPVSEVMVATLRAEPIARLELLKQRPWKVASPACTKHRRARVHRVTPGALPCPLRVTHLGWGLRPARRSRLGPRRRRLWQSLRKA